MELVSVIIPVYKVEKYLNKCVESVIKQTYKNLEIILVDDGSPDNCPIMCDEWAKKDSRIKVIHRKNGGLSAARNSGINVANGEYFCFVDSDDYVDPDYIKCLYEALKTNNADMAICEVTEVDEQYDIVVDKNSRKRLINETKTGLELLDYISSAKSYVYVIACNKIYKRELFNNLRYTEGKIHEDEFIIHRLLAKCKKIICIENPLYFYLSRNNSITGNCFNIKRMAKIEALKDRVVFYESLKEPKLVLKAKRTLLSIAAYYTMLMDSSLIIDRNTKIEFKKRIKQIYKDYFNDIQNSSYFSYQHKLPLFLYNISPALYKCCRKINLLRNRLLNRKSF